ncbi:hypothetical protein [Deinococcus hopiensis]|uniref:Uncharacterized protein n=1 Tax=Deinococcus hopiensis KR-140 TaxID=695939 RepID=A0A1W1V9L2_9DEIO|nr:hypothetical protein [Deinococcus hopiensis]SMB89936.1 hypothetical protein SAMN00790413_00590 [Deinococcus hopiensis KR-140]
MRPWMEAAPRVKLPEDAVRAFEDVQQVSNPDLLAALGRSALAVFRSGRQRGKGFCRTVQTGAT